MERGLRDPMLSGSDFSESGDAPSAGVPRREQLLHVGWMFLFASVTLLLEFVFFYTDFPSAAGGNITLAIGLVSSVEWLHGFIILWHWTWMLPGPKNVGSLVACSFKTVASVVFCIFPVTGLLGAPTLWSNFVGILLFHTGNMIDTYLMTRFQCNKKHCCTPSNYPTIMMWILLTATTFLVVGNSFAYVESNGGLANVSKTTLSLVEETGQVTGSVLLAVGSIVSIYTARKTGSNIDGE